MSWYASDHRLADVLKGEPLVGTGPDEVFLDVASHTLGENVRLSVGEVDIFIEPTLAREIASALVRSADQVEAVRA